MSDPGLDGTHTLEDVKRLHPDTDPRKLHLLIHQGWWWRKGPDSLWRAFEAVEMPATGPESPSA